MYIIHITFLILKGVVILCCICCIHTVRSSDDITGAGNGTNNNQNRWNTKLKTSIMNLFEEASMNRMIERLYNNETQQEISRRTTTSTKRINNCSDQDTNYSNNMNSNDTNQNTIITTTTNNSNNSNRNRIAFGSCNDQYEINSLWNVIQERNPIAFIWCGDAIYADKKHIVVPILYDDDNDIDQSIISVHTNHSYSNITNVGMYKLNRTTLIKLPSTGQNICAMSNVFDVYYQQQLNVTEYKSIIDDSTNIHIYGTIDDHDYGCNNADTTYPYKYNSNVAFIQFLNLSNTNKHNIMIQRVYDGLGVYGVQLYDFNQSSSTSGEQQQHVISDVDAKIDADLIRYTNTTATTTTTNKKNKKNSNNKKQQQQSSSSSSSSYTYSNQTVAVFVLDVRTNKSPWKYYWYERYQYDYNGDFLGQQQYIWLQQSILNSNATIHIYVSGLQYHSYRYFDSNVAESWSHYPIAQQKLYNTILSISHLKPSILISGDVHMTQLLRKDCVPYHTILSNTTNIYNNDNNNYIQPRSLIEFTTSGMTHSWGTIAKPIPIIQSIHDNHHQTHKTYYYRLLHKYYEYYQSYIAQCLIRILHIFCPWTDIMYSNSNNMNHSNNDSYHQYKYYNHGGGETSKIGLQYSLEQNYGEIEIDWFNESIILRSIGINGKPLLMASYHFQQLTGHIPMSNSSLSSKSKSKSSYLTKYDYLMEIKSNPKRYENYTINNYNDNHTNQKEQYEQQWVCINHRGRDTIIQHIIGHFISAIVLCIIIPLPIVLPLILIFALLYIIYNKVIRNRQWYRYQHVQNKMEYNHQYCNIQSGSYIQHNQVVESKYNTGIYKMNHHHNNKNVTIYPTRTGIWRLTWLTVHVPPPSIQKDQKKE